jgi:hypothetical protein
MILKNGVNRPLLSRSCLNLFSQLLLVKWLKSGARRVERECESKGLVTPFFNIINCAREIFCSGGLPIVGILIYLQYFQFYNSKIAMKWIKADVQKHHHFQFLQILFQALNLDYKYTTQYVYHIPYMIYGISLYDLLLNQRDVSWKEEKAASWVARRGLRSVRIGSLNLHLLD